MTAFPELIDKLQRRIDLTVDGRPGDGVIMDRRAQPSQIAPGCWSGSR
jgi:hypothetical protein